MGRELQSLSLADRNQEFLDAEAKIDQAIQIRQGMKVSTWRTMVKRGTFALGEGLEKSAYRFHPGQGQQRGLQLWHPIQISRKASEGDAGFDATKLNPHTVTYGFDKRSYSGLGIEYNTPNISIKDLRFMWQIRQQLGAVYGFLGDFTNDMWENYNREQYASMCNDAGKCFVIADGHPGNLTFAYDPVSADSDGDNILTIAGGKDRQIGVLDWKPLKWWSRYLQMQVPTAGIGAANGRPVFGWVGDLEDFETMIEEDATLREDWRHHSPSMLIENYGTVTNYKGYTLMHDMLSPRFAIKKIDGTDVVLKRIDPKSSSAATLIGSRTDVNEDYLNAEFGVFFIYMKDVFMNEIPAPGPSSPGGGTSFGASPGLNGQWKWLNIQDAKDNPLNQIGFWFMQAESFAKPLVNVEEPIMVLYRRFAHFDASDTELGGSAAAVEQALSEDAISGDVDSTNDTMEVDLAGYITAEAGDPITLVADDASALDGIVADSSNAPVYLLALASTPTFGDYTAAGGAKVTSG